MIEIACAGVEVIWRAVPLSGWLYKIDARDDQRWTVLVRADLEPDRRTEVASLILADLRGHLRRQRRVALAPVREVESGEHDVVEATGTDWSPRVV